MRWACTDFGLETVGVYEFAPVLPEGYALAEGVFAPMITVFIDGGMMLMAVGGEITVSTFEELQAAVAEFNGSGADRTIKVDADIDLTRRIDVTGAGKLTMTSELPQAPKHCCAV